MECIFEATENFSKNLHIVFRSLQQQQNIASPRLDMLNAFSITCKLFIHYNSLDQLHTFTNNQQGTIKL